MRVYIFQVIIIHYIINYLYGFKWLCARITAAKINHMSILGNKKILLGIAGDITSYKSAEHAGLLVSDIYSQFRRTRDYGVGKFQITPVQGTDCGGYDWDDS